MAEKINWTYLPFIFLSKIYIKFYNGKKDFWIIFPSAILSLIISLNVYVFVSLEYQISIYWTIGLYFLLYFVLFFIFHRRFPKYEMVEKVKLTKMEKTITLLLLIIAVICSLVVLNILRNRNI